MKTRFGGVGGNGVRGILSRACIIPMIPFFVNTFISVIYTTNRQVHEVKRSKRTARDSQLTAGKT